MTLKLIIDISIKDCAKMISSAECRNIVVLTGAGISVESGIPTYRDDNGYWTKGSENYRPQEMLQERFSIKTLLNSGSVILELHNYFRSPSQTRDIEN